jgi:hypothetical protein
MMEDELLMVEERKITKILSEDGRCPIRYSNCISPEDKYRALLQGQPVRSFVLLI